MSEATTLNSDLKTCDNEPIHVPGSIQPFGVLLAFDASSLTLRHTSENYPEIFGLSMAVPLGTTVAELLGAAAQIALRDEISKDGLIDPRAIPISVPRLDEKRWHALAHSLGGIVFVELEEADEENVTPIELISSIRVSVGRLSKVSTITEFCAAVTRKVRLLTGYDRVMVYRFDTEWNGEVIAEERRADLETYLGLHYPASDIPAQARALFLANRIRVIPDAISARSRWSRPATAELRFLWI